MINMSYSKPELIIRPNQKNKDFTLSEQYNPANDFYNHVNSKWLHDNPIPEDKTRWGTFDMLRDTTRDRVKNILQNVNINSNSTISKSELNLLINL